MQKNALALHGHVCAAARVTVLTMAASASGVQGQRAAVAGDSLLSYGTRVQVVSSALAPGWHSGVVGRVTGGVEASGCPSIFVQAGDTARFYVVELSDIIGLRVSDSSASARSEEAAKEEEVWTEIGVEVVRAKYPTCFHKPTTASAIPAEPDSTCRLEVPTTFGRNQAGNSRGSSGAMMVRWTAAGVLQAERHLRRIKGQRAMRKLVAALDSHDGQLGITNSTAAAWGLKIPPLNFNSGAGIACVLYRMVGTSQGGGHEQDVGSSCASGYSEGGGLRAAIAEVQRDVLDRVSGAVLLAVDDGSTDGSGAVLDEVGPDDSCVHVVPERNFGLGGALIAALELARSDFVFLIDSDRQIALESCGKLWGAVQSGSDAAYGVRRVRGDGPIRTTLTGLIRNVIRSVNGVPVRDANIPSKLLRHGDCLAARPFIPDDTLAPSILLVVFPKVRGLRVAKIDVPHRERPTGRPSVSGWNLVKVCTRGFVQLIQFRMRIRRTEAER